MAIPKHCPVFGKSNQLLPSSIPVEPLEASNGLQGASWKLETTGIVGCK